MVQHASMEVLTPTTLKCLTQLFEADEEMSHEFAVPLPPKQSKVFKLENSKGWQGGTTTVVSPSKSLTILNMPFSVMPEEPFVKTPAPKKAVARKTAKPRSRPGVKGKTNPDEEGLSPEEAEKLRIRRERNKAAAARCRKRRLDQISILSQEVNQHETKKRTLESQIAELRAQKEELEAILAEHQHSCGFASRQNGAHQDVVKIEPVETVCVEEFKPKRPLTLDIGAANKIAPPKMSAVQGVEIETPSTILGSLGFDSLMTSTGLTPSPMIMANPISFNTCSAQKRSNDNSTFTDLNTPSCEFTTLVSL